MPGSMDHAMSRPTRRPLPPACGLTPTPPPLHPLPARAGNNANDTIRDGAPAAAVPPKQREGRAVTGRPAGSQGAPSRPVSHGRHSRTRVRTAPSGPAARPCLPSRRGCRWRAERPGSLSYSRSLIRALSRARALARSLSRARRASQNSAHAAPS
eukprot:716186-Prymnesium_polylepis.1